MSLSAIDLTPITLPAVTRYACTGIPITHLNENELCSVPRFALADNPDAINTLITNYLYNNKRMNPIDVASRLEKTLNHSLYSLAIDRTTAVGRIDWFACVPR